MIKKYMSLVSILFILTVVFSLWFYPSTAPVIGIGFFLVGIAVAISPIIKKHKRSETPSVKIIGEILVLIVTLILTIFLGRMAGMYANQFTV